jgi:hypothetical protein
LDFSHYFEFGTRAYLFRRFYHAFTSVRERKWSSDRYEKWLGDALVSVLVTKKPSGKSGWLKKQRFAARVT